MKKFITSMVFSSDFPVNKGSKKTMANPIFTIVNKRNSVNAFIFPLLMKLVFNGNLKQICYIGITADLTHIYFLILDKNICALLYFFANY